MITSENIIAASIAYCLANPTVRHKITEEQLKRARATQADLVQRCSHEGIQTTFEDGAWILWAGQEAINGHETDAA